MSDAYSKRLQRIQAINEARKLANIKKAAKALGVAVPKDISKISNNVFSIQNALEKNIDTSREVEVKKIKSRLDKTEDNFTKRLLVNRLTKITDPKVIARDAENAKFKYFKVDVQHVARYFLSSDKGKNARKYPRAFWYVVRGVLKPRTLINNFSNEGDFRSTNTINTEVDRYVKLKNIIKEYIIRAKKEPTNVYDLRKALLSGIYKKLDGGYTKVNPYDSAIGPIVSWKVTPGGKDLYLNTMKLRAADNNMCYLEMLKHSIFRNRYPTHEKRVNVWLKHFNPNVSNTDSLELNPMGYTTDEVNSFLDARGVEYVIYDLLDNVVYQKRTTGHKTLYIRVTNQHLVVLDGIKTLIKENRFKTKERSVPAKDSEAQIVDIYEKINEVDLRKPYKVHTSGLLPWKLEYDDKIYVHKELPDKRHTDLLKEIKNTSTFLPKHVKTSIGLIHTVDLPKDAVQIDVKKCFTSILLNFEMPIEDPLQCWIYSKRVKPFKMSEVGYIISGVNDERFNIRKGDILPLQYTLLLDLDYIAYKITPGESLKELAMKCIEENPDDYKTVLNSLVGLFAIDTQILSKRAAMTDDENEASYLATNNRNVKSVFVNGTPAPDQDSEPIRRSLLTQVYEKPVTAHRKNWFNFCYDITKLYLIDIYQQCNKQNIEILGFYVDCLYARSMPQNLVNNVLLSLGVTAPEFGLYIQDTDEIPEGIFEKSNMSIYTQGDATDVSIDLSMLPETLEPTQTPAWQTLRDPRITKVEKGSTFELEFKPGHKVLIQAHAGAGKTTLINKLTQKCIDEFGSESVLRVAFSNCAAQLLGGKTLHRTFGIDMEGNNYLESQMSKVKLIVLDEYSMIPRGLWLMLFKNLRQDMMLVVAGDDKQLRAIDEQVDLYASHFYEELDEIIEMDYSYRFSEDYHKKCNKLRTMELSKEEVAELFKEHVRTDLPQDYLRITTLNSIIAKENASRDPQRYIVSETNSSLSVCKNMFLERDPESETYKPDPHFNHHSDKSGLEIQECEKIKSILKPGNAITPWRLQGQTIKDLTVVIYLSDFYKTWIDEDLRRRLLYVSFTRTSNVIVVQKSTPESAERETHESDILEEDNELSNVNDIL